MSIIENRQILLIDNDPTVNMISQKMIARYHPFKVIAFTLASQALDYVKECVDSGSGEFPELILLDINMTETDGWEFLNEFEKLPATALDRCKLVLLTSSIDHDDIEKSKKFKSVTEFIFKPLTQEKIRSLMPVIKLP
jgi:response regulator of citrate/malate metabolism